MAESPLDFKSGLQEQDVQVDRCYCRPVEIQDADKLMEKTHLCIIVFLVKKEIAKFGGLKPFGLVFIKDIVSSALSQ